MTESELEFGRTVSLDEVMLADIPGGEPQQNQVVSSVGDLVWEYHELGRINNIPVADTDLNLPIDREDLIDAAFTLKRIPRSKVFWMSPEDEESIKLYDDLLAQQTDGKIQIIEEAKQYDPNKGKFIVWLRYDETTIELKPRYAYLREEIK